MQKTTWSMVMMALGCAAPEPERPQREDTDTTEVVDSATPLDTGDTGTPLTTETGTPSTNKPTATPSNVDPFLVGDPSTIVGQLTLSWDLSDVPPSDWWITGYTFEPGKLEWTGNVLVAGTGLESCEVRDGDPELSLNPANAGAIDLHSVAGHVPTTSEVVGWYAGSERIGDLDPRGLDWQIVGEGDDLPSFDLPVAITFPIGELGVTAPVYGSNVSSAAPLAVTWTGDAAERAEIILSGGGIRVRCLADDDGAFEIDTATLGMIPIGLVSYEVSRVNVEGHTIGATDWLEVRALQVVRGTFKLTL